MKKDDTEQRLILAVLLSLGVYWLWMGMFAPPAPRVEAVDTVETAAATSDLPTGSSAVATQDDSASESPGTPELPPVTQWSSAFQTGVFTGDIGSDGGGLGSLLIPASLGPLQVVPIWRHWLGKSESADWEPWGEEPGPEKLLTEAGIFLAAGSGPGFDTGIWRQVGLGEEGNLAVQATGSNGIEITKTYTLDPTTGDTSLTVQFRNVGTTPWAGEAWVGAVDQFEGKATRYSNFARPALVADGSLETLNDVSKVAEAPKVMEGEVSWLGIGDRYFLAAAVPRTAQWGRGIFAKTSDDRVGAFLLRDLSLSPGASEVLAFNLYVGNKNLSELQAQGHMLDRSVNFGIFGFFSRILQMWQKLVVNWGVAIILLTVTVKISFWKLTTKSFASGRKMQALAPQMAEIKEKYKGDAQKAGQAQMELFKKEGVNPMSGCLPMLIQMPVWFALYSVLLFASDLYQAEFLYVRDLTSVDPYGVLPTLVGVVMVIQQFLTPMSPTMDPMQRKMMRMMPLVFVVIMYSFPSGLALYILVNTLFSIVQMWRVNKAYPLAPLPAKA